MPAYPAARPVFANDPRLTTRQLSCSLDAGGPPPKGPSPPADGAATFSDLPPDVQVRILALLPPSAAKRNLAAVSTAWRDLLLQGRAWPTVDVAPVTAAACAWLARRADGLADVAVRPGTEAEAILFNDVFLAAAPALGRLTLDAPWHTSFSFGYVWWALRFLDVASLRLRAQEVDAGALPPRLQALDIECARVAAPAALAALTRLTSLDLAIWSSKGGVDGEALLALKNLQTLAVNTHPFGGATFGKLDALPALTSVTLSAAPGFDCPVVLPPACALHYFTRAGLHPAAGGYRNLASLELKDVAGPRFDASILAPCKRLASLDVSFACETGHVDGLACLAGSLTSLKTGCPALRLTLPPLPRLAELEAVAFHDLDVVVDRAACGVLCKSLRSVYLAALDFGVGVTVFVHEAGRVGLDLRFATRPLRAVFTPNQMALMDDGSAPVEVVG